MGAIKFDIADTGNVEVKPDSVLTPGLWFLVAQNESDTGVIGESDSYWRPYLL